jgi:hypothetical protein
MLILNFKRYEDQLFYIGFFNRQHVWGRAFQQTIGIQMGTNCAPLLADLFPHTYEADFFCNLFIFPRTD